MRYSTVLSTMLGVVTVAGLTLGCADTETTGDTDAVAADEAGGEAMADSAMEYPGAVEAAPDHYTLVAENDAVRLLRVAYGPGETSALHSHPAHCAVALTATTWRMTPAEGEPTDLTLDAGEVTCVEAGAHQPQNTGEGRGEAILVEFKPGVTPGSDELPAHPDAVEADPDHYTVEFENDVARLLRITYDAGETSVMHRHPTNCAIFLNDQPTTMEMPDGEVVENPGFERGHVECGDAQAHLPTNVGDEGLELILVELQGRASWEG